jgi:hypothetical protein
MPQEADRRRHAQNAAIEFLTTHPRAVVALFAVTLVVATVSLSVAVEGLATGFEMAPDMGGSVYDNVGPGNGGEPSRDSTTPTID